MLRVASGDFLSYTEFEEGITFDEDDPDFNNQLDALPSLSIPLVLRGVPTKMSLAGVHPAEVHSTHGSLTTLSHSLDDISSSWSQTQLPNDHVLTIEELRLQLGSCFSCGVSWAESHVSLDCTECGGYALERPCTKCDGRCGSIWKRDLTMSHASGKARWEGECLLNTNSNALKNSESNLPGQCAQQSKNETSNALAKELCSRLEKLSATS